MVTVFGLGFVGLTTALCFAHFGNKVYGIDVDEHRKAQLRNGELTFVEPDMDEVLRAQLNKNFFVTDDIEKAVTASDYVFYCVGTPYGTDGAADLKYLFSAIDSTIEAIHDDKHRVLVTKSTIPPTTTRDKIIPYIKDKGNVAKNVSIANNPEFLREGHCWKDVTHAERIVLGCSDIKSQEMLKTLYAPMNIPVFCVSVTTGEFIKYLSNTLLATLISYSNEMADIADAFGDIDVAKAFHIVHMDGRWNHADMANYFYPGCGYGGYCLPKDTNALYSQAKAKGITPAILGEVIRTNDERAQRMAEKIAISVPHLENKHRARIGILGLSFKPDSDDVRDTPAAKIICELQKLGDYEIVAYDPLAAKNFAHAYPDIRARYCDTAREVVQQSDVIAIVTAWKEFKEMDFEENTIVDCRYMFEKDSREK